MNYLLLLTIVSAICSILGFFSAKFINERRWLWLIVVFILTFASGYAVYSNGELGRIKNIHRQANAIYEDYYHCSYEEFIQEALTFLEENQDQYEDSYKRAKQIDSVVNSSVVKYYSEEATKLRGIIKGIATLNNKE